MGGIFGSTKVEGVDFDLDGVQPSDLEQKMHDEVDLVLSRKDEIISEIEDYKGCQDLAKAAMGRVGGGAKTQSDDSSAEKTCFDALLEAVKKIALFNDYAKEVGNVWPLLLETLSDDTDGKKVAELNKYPALAIQLGQVLDFALRFDGARMLKPEVSNDFSYYRRLLPKYSSTHQGIEVKEDVASSMALFTGEHSPMMNVLIKSTVDMKKNNPGVVLVLSTMVNSCMMMVKQKKVSKEETCLFCVRAMTGALVLFDHVDDVGAFGKKSAVDVKQCINLLKKDFPDEGGLLNSIRYSTKNFSDAPDSVQNLFD